MYRDDKNAIISWPLFIADMVVLGSAIITIFVLGVFGNIGVKGTGIIFVGMEAITFVVIVFWKAYLAIALLISTTYLALTIRRIKQYKFAIAQREVAFFTFAIAVSLSLAFFYAARIRSGKPDMEPGVFFAYFLPAIACFLITRIGIGIFVYYNSRKH